MNLEAEKGTLSALLTINDFAATLPFKLQPEDFFEAGNKAIAKVVLKLIDEGVLKISKDIIISTARDKGMSDFLHLTADGKVLDAILKMKPSKEEATIFLKQVKKESLRSTAINRLKDLTDYVGETNDTLGNILTKCEDTIFSLTSSADFSENNVVHLADGIEDYINFLGDNPGQDGLDIGFPEWQKCVGGVGNGKVHLIIATNKTGKSTIGARAAYLLGQHIPVLIIDTEMTDNDQKLRLFGMMTKIPYTTIKEGNWKDPSHEDHRFYDRIMQGIKDFKNLNIDYISAAGKSVADMVPAMRRWVIQNKAWSDGKFPRGLIVYDYMKLTSYEELVKARLSEWQKLGLDASSLKDFANKYKVPVITFGQTNREEDDSINCLGASKRLADLCDSVSLFKEKTPELLAKDPTGTHLMRVFVSRHGPSTGYGHHIRLAFDKSIGYLEELGMYTPTIQPKQEKKYKKKDISVDDILEGLDDNTDDGTIY